MTNLEIIDHVNEIIGDDPEILENLYILDTEAFADAVIGLSEDHRLVYDFDKMVEGLMKHEGMSDTEAIEFIEFNTLRSLPYLSNPPIIVYPLTSGENNFDEEKCYE